MEDKPHPLLSRAMDFEAPRHQQVPPTVPRARLLLQTYYHLSRRVIVIILSSFSPTGSMPDIPPPAHHAFGRCRRSVNGGPHVQVEDRLACGFWRGRVVVYHISDFAYGAVRGPAFDVPVVAVKWGFEAASLPLLASYSKSKGEEGGMKEMMISWGGGIRAYANLDGYILPIKAHTLALGVISFGLPWNRISFGFNLACSSATMLLVPLLSNSSSPNEHICHPWLRPRLNRSSQASISCQAPSLRKLCTATMDSTASSGVSSNPLRSIALYICCGEGYSQLESESPRGIEDMVRSSGRWVF